MILLALLALAGPAHAIGDWQCKAEGYDQFRQRWEIESERHIVIWEAERDALRQCRAEGYRNCRIFYCSEAN